MVAVTGSQALFNHLGIRVTTWLTDFSGYLILVVALALTVAMLWCAPSHDFGRLITWTNYSGLPKEAPVWPVDRQLALAVRAGLPAADVHHHRV